VFQKSSVSKIARHTSARLSGLFIRFLVNGSLNPLFNAFTTVGFLMFDQGRSECISNVVYDRFNKGVILADTMLGLSGKKDIRLSG
jgi:hypothetical protein